MKKVATGIEGLKKTGGEERSEKRGKSKASILTKSQKSPLKN